MKELNIKDLVKNNWVKFDSYRQGYFYYIIHVGIDDFGDPIGTYQFPVPLDDIGTATLLGQDKAITFMRWIRRAIKDKTFVKP
jgi:hypothetical protein